MTTTTTTRSWWADAKPEEFADRVAAEQTRIRNSKFGQMNTQNLTIHGGRERPRRVLDAAPDRTDDVE